MEALNFAIGIFDKLLILMAILHLSGIYFACKLHKLVHKNKNSSLWFVSAIFPFLVPLAAYNTGVQASYFFTKKKIEAKVDFGIIHSALNIIGVLIALGAGVFLYNSESGTMDDFYIFCMICISSLFIFILSHFFCAYTYFSLSKSVIAWKEQRRLAKKAPSVAQL